MDSQHIDQEVVGTAAGEASADTDDVTVETLVEEVSIDGMCGVY